MERFRVTIFGGSMLRANRRISRARLVLSAAGWMASAAALSQTPTFRVDSRLVQANCTAVEHKSNRPVVITSPNDVVLWEDDKQLPLVDVRRAEDTPLLLFLLLDMSGSEASNWDLIREQTAVFVEKALKPGDRIAVLTFDIHVRLLIDVTDPKAPVERLAERLRTMSRRDGKEIVPLQSGYGGGGTRLWDTISIAAQVSMKARDRHAALVFTDGGENGSLMEAADVLKQAQSASMPIYEVENLTDVSSTTARNYMEGPVEMRRLVEKTGGIVINGDGKRARVAADLDRLADIMRMQFLVEYKPPPGGPARLHSLKVKPVDKSLDVRCKAAVWH